MARDPKRGRGGKKRSPLLGAAVLRALLARQLEGQDAERDLYRGILRDLDVTDEQVEQYLDAHRDEVEAAIRAHRGRDQ